MAQKILSRKCTEFQICRTRRRAMSQACQDRPGGNRRQVWKHEGAQMPGAKRFLHPYLHNRSIEPGTGACICIICLSWN